jgi:hypothetical protein
MHDFHGTYSVFLHAAKSTTWDRRLYFPSEGRSAEDFFALKNPTASAGFEPANLGTEGQHATPRPQKPLTPPLPNVVSHHKTKTERHARHFFISQYEKDDWLAGCGRADKLYTVDPVHFFNYSTNTECFPDLNLLSGAQQKHSDHIKSRALLSTV